MYTERPWLEVANAAEEDAWLHVERTQDQLDEHGSRWTGAVIQGAAQGDKPAAANDDGCPRPASRPALPGTVRAAFERHGLPVPTVERVDRVGYSSTEIRAIEAEIARRNRRAA